MRYIVVIPARAGSKRLPHKNKLTLCGKPLVSYSIDYAKAELPGIPIVVSTDDTEILDIARSAGVIALPRPIELCGDHCATGDVLRHVSDCVRQKDLLYDYMVLLQPTSPLRPKGMLGEAVRLLNETKKDGLFSVSPSLLKFGKITDGQFQPWNYAFGQRSQDMEPLYFENGLLYVTSRSVIEQGLVMTKDCFPMIIKHPYATVDIDTEEDFKYAEYLLRSV